MLNSYKLLSEHLIKNIFTLFIIGLLGIQANASNWVGIQNSLDATFKSYIDLDSIRSYKEGDAENSKDNYRSAFIEFNIESINSYDNEVVRIMNLYVVNCDKNKLIILDSISFDAQDNIVVPQREVILSDTDMRTVFPKTKVAYIYNLMCF